MIALADRSYRAIAAIVEREAGLYMPETKKTFLASRLQRRLRFHGLNDFETYVRLIGDPGAAGTTERRHLVSALTTNVTAIYREPHHFDLLARHLLDRRRQGVEAGGGLRIWSAGCSTGEEPLSIAAVCLHVFGPSWTNDAQIIATDVDLSVLETARTRDDSATLGPALAAVSSLPGGRTRDLPQAPDHLLALLRGGITYRHHNLLDDLDLPGQFDVIFCRNVTIYFSAVVQKAVHERLRARLAPAGMLVLGHSERLLGDRPELVSAGRTTFRRPLPDENVLARKAIRCR
ncbi:protein-glutamate O-methyltransferase CheR [Jannaschia helgolandensis]|uniref:CheR family methyltransferase n=1 Tax=Jannaschia helgolandensis TaxID=188906 RepID=UPI0030D78B1B